MGHRDGLGYHDRDGETGAAQRGGPARLTRHGPACFGLAATLGVCWCARASAPVCALPRYGGLDEEYKIIITNYNEL